MKAIEITQYGAPEVLRAHLQTLQWQRLPQGVSLSFYFVDDNLDNESSELLASVEGACVFEYS